MKLKENIFTALLLAIGFILHQITPGILGGMKFDFLLSFIFVSLLLNNTFNNAILTGLLGGLLSAMATSFPGGQIPNMIDKLLTCLIVFVILKSLERFNLKTFVIGFVSVLGTFISGMIFLLSALFISGLPAPLGALIITVVIPTTIVNGLGTVFIYGTIKKALRMSGISTGQI